MVWAECQLAALLRVLPQARAASAGAREGRLAGVVRCGRTLRIPVATIGALRTKQLRSLGAVA